MRRPDQIVLAPIAKPLVHTEKGYESVFDTVELATWTPRAGDRFKPERDVEVTGYEWTGWTWFGWTLIFMWKQ